ncbi:NADPH-dependent FMN reductase [Antrihabitans sp. YC2-6]|uniref:NADPH-dependent FMN reductase n=1 Tax=Antrihabitans sp. YC2-6 TaxID=2799498 RepID=UPI0018F70764|nr:NAD(P)H-dependent oxidoreductase [Antrihabitans sp. YC2-6]MBJ8347471.1 NAD(P)H-dependent oxidoreductase [Antrihabitans sp. YC2-6]
MDQVPLRLEVLIGSVREGRIGVVVADWFLRRARADPAFDTGVIDLADTPLALDLALHTDAADFRSRLAAADAFVAITPEYNHGYSGALKNAFDSAKHEWRAKPIGFVSYGGLSGGLRATEQLRQVVAELHMVSIRQTVSFHQVRKAFDDQGEVNDGATIDAAPRLLQQLAWWGRALRSARAADPYPG